jgi:hypothetical protein
MCSLPPSTEGEWWELSDDSRGGIPYYYQTKTGETVWERPDSFVIPLTVIQVIHSRQLIFLIRVANTFLYSKPPWVAACRRMAYAKQLLKGRDLLQRQVCLPVELGLDHRQA